MNFSIILVISVVTASSGYVIDYSGYNYDNYNMPVNSYPTYPAPVPYQLNHFAEKPHYASAKASAICATNNGMWRTFDNVYQFKNENNMGQAWNFHSYGSCPKYTKPVTDRDEPICATYNNEFKTFTNKLALEVDSLVTGKNWIKLYSGICPHIPTPITSTTAVPMPKIPCSTEPVCGILNGVWKTFKNLTQFNEEIDKGTGWSLYSFGICPKPEVCAKFGNEFRTFPTALALEVEKIVTGKDWFIVSSGVCTSSVTTTSTTSSTTTTTTSPTTELTTESTTKSTTIPTTSSSTRSTATPPVAAADENFSITTEDSTTEVTSQRTTRPYKPNVPEDFDGMDNTTPCGCKTLNRIQQHNNYHGPYIEGSFHYNHNMFNQANFKHYQNRRY